MPKDDASMVDEVEKILAPPSGTIAYLDRPGLMDGGVEYRQEPGLQNRQWTTKEDKRGR